MDVIVIGSGAAGIAAMRKLVESGLKTVCLEAAERIGGRVNTVSFADSVVDLGAVEIEGSIGNVVAELGKPYGLLQDSLKQENFYVQSNGSSVSKDIVQRFANRIDDLISKADKENTKSVAQFVEETVKSDAVNEDPVLKSSLVEWYKRLNELGGEADPNLGKSMKQTEIRKPCEGPFQSWKTGGMGTILDILMKKIPDPTKALQIDIKLHKEVDTIKWKGSDLVRVTCKDGDVFEARSVITTIPVGVLKERHINLFDPPLPAEKINTINSINTMVLDKIYMEFTAPWWGTPCKYNILWRAEDKVNFTGEEKWITYVYGIETVLNNDKVIMAWIYDEGARLMEKCNEDDVKKGMNKLLSSLFKDKFAVTPIKKLLRTKWATNRWARGSYSYRSAYTEQNGADPDILAKPLTGDAGTPALCFAGEATVNEHQASVHGAIESGFREAERLIRVLK